MGSPPASAFDLAALGEGTSSTFLYGRSRAVVNRLLYAMARAIDPEPIWLDLSPGALGPGDDAGPVELGWVPRERLFVTWDIREARPQSAVGQSALMRVVRADDPSGSVARLADFVRLPPIAQEVISRVDVGVPRHALAVANSDRVRRDYPNTIDGVRPIVTQLLEAPLCPLFGVQGVPGPGRMAFSYVFEVRAADVAHWRDGTLVVEKTPRDAPIPNGQEIRLIEIPGLEKVFGAAQGPGQSP
jgi:hypothetical protein